MFLVNFLVYYGFKLWATIRIQLKPKCNYQQIKKLLNFSIHTLDILAEYQPLWDRSWIMIIIAYDMGFMYIFTWAIIKMEMQPAASLTLLSEIVSTSYFTIFLLLSSCLISDTIPYEILRFYKKQCTNSINI